MEAAVPGGESCPLTEDIGVLTAVADDYDGVFKNIYDVPYVTVNRVEDEIHAEVHLTGYAEIDHDRLMTAHSVAREKGFRSYCRFFADLYEDDNVVHLKFSDDPSKGTIWCLLEEEAGDTWSR
jgi:hypothetical protein